MSKRRVAIVGILSAQIAANAWSADPVLHSAPLHMHPQAAHANVERASPDHAVDARRQSREPYKRLKWDFRHVLDSSSGNPYVAAGEGDAKPKNRTGFEDLSHAIKNLFVEARRARKHEARQ